MIFQPTFVMSSTITRAAYSFAVRAASAVLFVGMSVWAMGSATLDLSKIATPNVFLLCDGLQVSRVDAAAHAAQVVELQPFWNRAAQCFIHDAVGIAVHPASLFSYAGIFYHDTPVASRSNLTHPNPTAGFSNHFYVLHQPFYSWNSHRGSFSASLGQARCSADTLRGPYLHSISGGVA